MIAPAAPRRAALAALTAVTLLVTAGCPEQSAEVVEPPKKEPTPEERFEKLVAEIRSRVEDDRAGMGAAVRDINAQPGEPVTVGSFRVASQLIAPTTDDETYRGIVSLFSKSKVTVTVPAPEKSEEPQAAPAEDDLDLKIEGLPDLDQLRVPKQSAASTTLRPSPLHEIEPGETRTDVEFEFRDGLWALVTEVDQTEQPFYKLAIDQALSQQ